jgi:hypothetical protein
MIVRDCAAEPRLKVAGHLEQEVGAPMKSQRFQQGTDAPSLPSDVSRAGELFDELVVNWQDLFRSCPMQQNL